MFEKKKLNPWAAPLPQYNPAIVLSQSYPFEFQRNILSHSFVSVFQRDILPVLSSNDNRLPAALGYGFISHQFHTEHDLTRTLIRGFAGTTLPLLSLEFAESEIDLHLGKHDLSCWPNIATSMCQTSMLAQGRLVVRVSQRDK